MMRLEPEYYNELLREMHQELANLESQVSEIEDAIAVTQRLQKAAYQRRIEERAKAAVDISASADAKADPNGKYAKISTRWAILWLLSEGDVALSTSVIAAELTKGGVTTRSANFVSNVSAVLSVMMRDRKEVIQEGNVWRITDVGRQAWSHIQARRQTDASYGIREPNN